jgi:polysaccharide deacetylase family protein (PEP-CTERM system associated)
VISAGSRKGTAFPCMLTFDIEEWFQVENLRPIFAPPTWERLPRRIHAPTRTLLELLAAHGVRATFFVLGWVAEREPSLVREIAEAGHEIASHGYGHIMPTTLSPAAFKEDVSRARAVLEPIAGRPVMGYRAPSFNIDRERLAILAELGLRYDSSYHPFTLHDRYARLERPGMPVAPGVYRMETDLIEIELPVERLGRLTVPVSGGGYFRLYPGALFRTLVRRSIERYGHYTMYLHSWEFDAEQPRVRGAGMVGTFRHYNNLSRTLPRMRRLLEMLQAMEARFIAVGDFMEEVAPSMIQQRVSGGQRS